MRHFAVLLALLAAAQTAGCIAMNPTPNCASAGAIVAGKNEPSFVERYSLNISLPIPDEEFRGIIEKLGLRYSAMGPNGELPISKPRHCPAFDMSSVDRGYLVYAGHDADTGRTEGYMALVDRHGQVIYIENRYQYPPVVR